MKNTMTPKEIAEKSWTLWNDYYKYNDKTSEEIISILVADMEALNKDNVVNTVCEHKHKTKILNETKSNK